MSRRMRSAKLVTGINVAPLTDIALVLLVVFMVATPMIMQSSIKVNLPESVSKVSTKDKGITILIDKKGRIFVNDDKMTLKDLKMMLSSRLLDNPNQAVVIDGDKSVKYDMIVKVLDAAREAGVKKFSLGVKVN